MSVRGSVCSRRFVTERIQLSLYLFERIVETLQTGCGQLHTQRSRGRNALTHAHAPSDTQQRG